VARRASLGFVHTDTGSPESDSSHVCWPGYGAGAAYSSGPPCCAPGRPLSPWTNGQDNLLLPCRSSHVPLGPQQPAPSAIANRWQAERSAALQLPSLQVYYAQTTAYTAGSDERRGSSLQTVRTCIHQSHQLIPLAVKSLQPLGVGGHGPLVVVDVPNEQSLAGNRFASDKPAWRMRLRICSSELSIRR
jgi:hypothetical protein